MVSGLFHIVIHVSESAYIKYINSVNTLPNLQMMRVVLKQTQMNK